MGCGSSRHETLDWAETRRNSALADYLSSILGIEPTSKDVVEYVKRLRAEGFDTPEDVDTLAVGTLNAAPFNFKHGHLLKITQSRTRARPPQPDNAEGVDAFAASRERFGRTQRQFSPGTTDLYQHEAGWATANTTRFQAHRANASAQQADEDCIAALTAHIASMLGTALASADVKRYVARLRSEGCETPDDVDALTVDELAEEPFNFKRLHIKKVIRSRGEQEKGVSTQGLRRSTPPRHEANMRQVRGQCSLCGMDVFDSQPRLKDHTTGLYQHEDCRASNRASRPKSEPGLTETGVIDADGSHNSALAVRLSALLEMNPASETVQQYVAALRSEGCETTEDLDMIGLEELKAEPYQFKRFHLLKLEQARGKQMLLRTPNADAQRQSFSAPPLTVLDAVRGSCSLCNRDILDTHQTRKDPSTGLHQHEACWRAADAARAEVFARAQREEAAAAAAVVAADKLEAEAAVIKAATEAARAELDAIVKARQQAEFALARANADSALAERPASERASATTGTQNSSDETASAVMSASTTSTFTTRKQPMLPAAPKVKPLLPDGKHAFLSYQWDVQDQVKEIKERLNRRQVKCWMDIDGGMKSDIYDSMAEGLQGAACLLCFMSQAYQDSANCKLELKFAQQSGVPIIPVMMQANFTAKGWLGILTAGSIWTPMYESESVPSGIDKLVAQARILVPGMRKADDDDSVADDSESESGSIFDVGAWGDEMFSLEEMKEELDRLREETAPSLKSKGSDGAAGGSMCALPAMVPTLPRGLLVTAAMQSVLDAVVSDAVVLDADNTANGAQIGFCGMGGIGKTTVSCWVARNESVRERFGMVAWITLGQTPAVDACINLLHLQLTGSELSDGGSDRKHELLQKAFLGRSVLLVLDDCWDIEVAKNFTWIDQHTNSKVLISSRVRDVLDGGQIFDVNVPSESDAVKMLLSTAGMDIETLQDRKEVVQVAEMCKRLPLSISVAGKLIRQLAQGSPMTDAADWLDIVSLLEEELSSDENKSIEESVIRASIKAIPKKIQKRATQLFLSFALVPEDTHVPLPILGLVFNACGASLAADEEAAAAATKPLSRLQMRQYLKVLIDRSLVLGTVDRPQLHDVMLVYVQQQLSGESYKSAQRSLVDALRKTDRSTSSTTGKYMSSYALHHVKAAYDESWAKGSQALSWLEDHLHGVQNTIAASTATLLPVEDLAKEAEASAMWWKAALRWNAMAMVKTAESGVFSGAIVALKAAVAASEHADPASAVDAGFTQYDLDSFDVNALQLILKAWDPKDLGIYGGRLNEVLATPAGRSRPMIGLGVTMALEWYPALTGGNPEAHSAACWKMAKLVLDMFDESSDVYSLVTEEDQSNVKPMVVFTLCLAGDGLLKVPGFSWDGFGHQGQLLYDAVTAFNYEEHAPIAIGLYSCVTPAIFGSGQWLLSMHYGRVHDAIKLLDDNLHHTEKLVANPAAGFVHSFMWSAGSLATVYTIHGMSQHVAKHYAMLGLSFDTAEERVSEVTGPDAMFQPIDAVGPDKDGIMPITRAVWHIKSLCILNNMNVPDAKAIAWLQSLPDDETFILMTCVMGTHDLGTNFNGCYYTYTIALAHEKVGLYEGAIRFANLQLVPEPSKGGNPHAKYTHVIALACKGRALAKLGRHAEALAAFQLAITTSKESFNLIEALAYRELAKYAEGGEAAAQAAADLDAKLAGFDGRLARADFDKLKIAP